MSFPADVPKIAAAAVASEQATGFPALLAAAQCALESGWLDSAPENNAFGVKWHKSQPSDMRQLVTTREWFMPERAQQWLAEAGYEGRELIRETGKTDKLKREYLVRDWFMRYPSLAESFASHARLITTGGPYRKAWEAFLTHRKPEQLMRDMAGTYATDPNYSITALSIMRMPVLRQAIEEAQR